MILSDEGIKEVISLGLIEIDSPPQADQYTSSALDLVLGGNFKIWDPDLFDVQGTEIRLDLSSQDYLQTAKAYLKDADCENDGSCILAPYSRGENKSYAPQGNVFTWPMIRC